MQFLKALNLKQIISFFQPMLFSCNILAIFAEYDKVEFLIFQPDLLDSQPIYLVLHRMHKIIRTDLS